MRQRAAAKVEAEEARATEWENKAAQAKKAAADAELQKTPRGRRQKEFDEKQDELGLPRRRLTPGEHADLGLEERYRAEQKTAAEAAKSPVPKRPVRSAEAEEKAKARREEGFQREQQAAGVGEQDLRQLTPGEHEKLADLEQQRDTARAEEKAALQSLEKAGKPALQSLEKAGKPAPRSESAPGEPARAEDQATIDADSSMAPADRAFDSMVKRATAKVEAQKAKAAEAKDAAAKANRSPHEMRRDQRQEQFDKEQREYGLPTRRLTPKEHLDRAIQEAHARENGKPTASRAKAEQDQRTEGAKSPAGAPKPGPRDRNARTREHADKFDRNKSEDGVSTETTGASSSAKPSDQPSPNPTRQLFRINLKTGELHLVKVVRGDRPGGSGPAGEGRADAGGAKASDQYEYREVDPSARTVFKTHLGPDEVVVSAKPTGGQEHSAFAYRQGQRIPIGDPAERMAVYDHATGTWDVAGVSRKPSEATSERGHQVSGPRDRAPAPPRDDVKPVQALRRDGDGNIDLLTYERPPENVRLPGGGKNDGFEYHGLDEDGPDGWHYGTPLGSPKVERLVTAPKANRVDGGPVADGASNVIVRDPKTGLYQTLTEVSSGAKTGPMGPGKSYYRFKDDGTPERVEFKGDDELDVVKVHADGTVARTKWAPSGKGNAAPVLDKDGSLTSASPRRLSIDELRYDKVGGQIIRTEDTHSRGPGGGSDDGPGGGKGFGTRTKSTGSKTENIVETYTEEHPHTAAKAAEEGGDRPAADEEKAPGKDRFPGEGRAPGESSARPDGNARANGFEKLIGRPSEGSGEGAGGGAQRVRGGDGSGTATEHPDAPATDHPVGVPGEVKDQPAADHDAAPSSGDVRARTDAGAGAGAKDERPAHEVRRDRRQEQFDNEQDKRGLPRRKLTPKEHLDRAIEEAHDHERANAAGNGKPAAPKKSARTGERQRQAASHRQETFAREQRAAGVREEDLRQLTQEEHERLADLERRMDTARAEEKAALQAVKKAEPRTEPDADGEESSKTADTTSTETPPAAPVREPVGQQVLDDAGQTLTLVGRVDDAVAQELRADGRILAEHFAGLPGATELSPVEEANVGELFGAELAWGGFEGAVRFGERLFGVDPGSLPSEETLDGVGRRAMLDPRRADAVLSLRLGSDRYREAALRLLNEAATSPEAVSPDQVKVVAARIAQNSISDVVAEAGRSLAADLLNGTRRPLPYEPRGLEAAGQPLREPEPALRQALATVQTLSPDASARVWAEAGAIVRETAAAPEHGLMAYLQESFRPRLLVAAELADGGPDAARALARTLATADGTGGDDAGPSAHGPVPDPATMLLVQGVVWRTRTALRALGEEPGLLASLTGQADDVLEQLGLPPGHVLDATGFLAGGETGDGRSLSQAVDDLAHALTRRADAGPAPLPATPRTPSEQDGSTHVEEGAESLVTGRSAGVPADELDWRDSTFSAGPYCVQAALVRRERNQ
ncbi:hypothetical protein [Actinoallomurus acaciae]|uniref:Uncharacterized protein n=1 Tax=Actinoallomurus acaciae TaxID=502577 RepID=A0ABV5YLD5_9ACTN